MTITLLLSLIIDEAKKDLRVVPRGSDLVVNHSIAVFSSTKSFAFWERERKTKNREIMK